MDADTPIVIYPEQELTQKILKGAFAVHNTLGCGFLEKAYSNALLMELRWMGLGASKRSHSKCDIKEAIIGDYFADLIVERRDLVELKACVGLEKVHEAQILNYLKASGIHVGLLMNFGKPKLEYRRFNL